MVRVLFFVYGVASYSFFFATNLYSIGFLGNLWVPKSIDSGRVGGMWQSGLVNMLLLGLFAAQHTIMARKSFKTWWTRLVPQPIERSTYVLFSSLVIVLLVLYWRPMTGTVWNIHNQAGSFVVWTLFWSGWALVVGGSFLIDHFDLFGLRQVYLHLKRRQHTGTEFKTPLLYKLIRHPLYLGFIIAFWSAPLMTVGHFLFAAAMTVYTLVGIQHEERDLIGLHGSVYEDYRRRVPMLLPIPKKRCIREEG